MKTWIHLQHEGFLLLALTLLSAASFQSIYKEKFGLPGDIIFCSLTTLWLSRYILARWICTLDNSTCAAPTIQGVLAHLLSSHFFAGQYFDRPSPQVLVKNGIGKVGEDGRATGWSTFVMPSVLAAWDWFRVRILFPTLKRRDASYSTVGRSNLDSSSHHQHHHNTPHQTKGRKGDNSLSTSSLSQQRMPPMMQSALQSWGKIYNSLSPALQISIPACTLIYYTWKLPFARYLLPFTARHRFATDSSASSSLEATLEPPEWSEVFFVASLPTVVSLLCFSRLINPIPDLVAGSNVLKAVRNEAKNQGGFHSVSSYACLCRRI